MHCARLTAVSALIAVTAPHVHLISSLLKPTHVYLPVPLLSILIINSVVSALILASLVLPPLLASPVKQVFFIIRTVVYGLVPLVHFSTQQLLFANPVPPTAHPVLLLAAYNV